MDEPCLSAVGATLVVARTLFGQAQGLPWRSHRLERWYNADRSDLMTCEDKDADEGMKETLHLLRSPVNAARLLRSIAEADAGKLIEHEPIEPSPEDA